MEEAHLKRIGVEGVAGQISVLWQTRGLVHNGFSMNMA